MLPRCFKIQFKQVDIFLASWPTSDTTIRVLSVEWSGSSAPRLVLWKSPTSSFHKEPLDSLSHWALGRKTPSSFCPGLPSTAVHRDHRLSTDGQCLQSRRHLGRVSPVVSAKETQVVWFPKLSQRPPSIWRVNIWLWGWDEWLDLWQSQYRALWS